MMLVVNKGMNSADYRATALLTEHLGFAPLTLIDEVINDVNQIMYNCTDALERFLIKRRESQIQSLRENTDKSLRPEHDSVFPLDEIKLGAAELETLLVSHVDKNFDKFELYTLRNILTIPMDLVEGGWVRLKHHEGLDLSAPIDLEDLNRSNHLMKPLIDNINLELRLRKLLLLQKTKATKILHMLKISKKCVDEVILANSTTKLLPETAKTLKQHLQPINENVYYLLGQVDELLQQFHRLNNKFMMDKTLNGIGGLQFAPSNRDHYVHDKSKRIMEEVGVLGSDSRENSQATVLYSAYAHTSAVNSTD